VIGAGTYVLTTALLAAVILAVGFSAVRIRHRLLPEWDGAPSHLIDAVVAVALLIWLSELLGVMQLFYDWALVIASLLLAGAAYAWPPIIAPATANATIVLIILRSPCPPPRLGGVVFRKFLTDVWR